MDGHASQVGGVVVDSGNFDWEAYSEKFQGLTTPDESYHGLIYTKSFGKLAYIIEARYSVDERPWKYSCTAEFISA